MINRDLHRSWKGKSGLLLLLSVIAVYPLFAQDGFIAGSPALAYWKVGHKKQIIVVVHGGPAAPHNYLRPELDQLAKFAQVIYYDQRGCGKSQAADAYDWQLHVDDLDRLLKTLAPKQKVFLMGSSWGSALAMLYAYKHPDKLKGLILSGTVGWEGKGLDAAQLEKHIRESYTPQPYRIITMKMYEHKEATSSEGTRILPIEKSIEKQNGPSSALTRLSWASAPVLDSLKTVMTPVLIFNGDAPNCDVDRGTQYATIFRHAQLVTIHSACHDPWFSNPDLFAKISGSFVRKHKK